MSNFAASPVNSLFYCGMIQHEPGPVCSTLQDKPFSQNYDECLRFYQKTYDYPVAPGTAAVGGGQATIMQNASSVTTVLGHLPFKKPMAKVPTVAAYSPTTGVIQAIRDVTAATDRSVTSYASSE